jgi:hypothetical protein
VRPQHHDHRRRLRELIQHFESDAQLHSKMVPCYSLEVATNPRNARQNRPFCFN